MYGLRIRGSKLLSQGFTPEEMERALRHFGLGYRLTAGDTIWVILGSLENLRTWFFNHYMAGDWEAAGEEWNKNPPIKDN